MRTGAHEAPRSEDFILIIAGIWPITRTIF